MKFGYRIAKNKMLIRDITIMFLIIILPFLFYIYTLVPENTKVWNTVLFEFNSGYFESIDLLFWSLSIKFLTIGLLSLWFISCTQKWKMVLVVPIFFELYKLLVNINYALNIDDQVDYQKLILILILYLIILSAISFKLKFLSINSNATILVNQEINNQMVRVSELNISDYRIINEEYNRIRSSETILDKKEYLLRLITLRDKLTS